MHRLPPPALPTTSGPFVSGPVRFGLIAFGIVALGPGGLGSAAAADTVRAEPPPTAPSSDPAPGPHAAVVESFTRSIQPLLLNRCATAGCHVGPKSPEPRFLHRNARGHIDREVTLANLQTVERLIEDERALGRLLREWLSGHPTPIDTAPLTPATAAALRRWLASKRVIEARPAATNPPLPNRFQVMLEAAANPVPLWPPPQAPRGILLLDDPPGEADGPRAD
jgi:hypothetical protein